MKIIINSNAYAIDDGFTLTENYNETLDSASIRISHLSSEIEIEPFDDVELQQNDGTKYRDMCVDSFDCMQEAIGQNDTTYTYTINLFSLTKKLESVILPNLSITPRKNGDQLTILQYLSNIKDLYAPQIWYDEDELYIPNWGFSNNFIDKFEDIICPEMQWSTPTFRELLTDLTMTQDCIPILRKKNNSDMSNPSYPYEFQAEYLIDFINITRSTVTDKTYNYVTKSMSSDDYISEIKMNLQNVMQTNVEGINNVVTTAEFLTLTSDDNIITSENCYLKTQFPILNIKNLWLICFCSDGTVEHPGQQNDIKTTLFRQNLCQIRSEYNDEQDYYSLVVEKKEYDSKKPLYRTDIVDVIAISQNDGYTIGDYYSKYRNFYVYYTRNSNRIEGFSELVKPIFATETSTLYYLKKISAYNAVATGQLNMAYGYNVADCINDTKNSYFSTFFQIEYETTYDAVFSASKTKRPNNNRVIADNQTNAWVDAYSQGFLEYQKANRLGNLQKMYNQRKTELSDLYEIGDKINDDIVYRTEYQFYPDHLECNAYATKNYVLQNYFTGIKSKIRTWVNAREEAFIRHDLKKYYCEFSYTPHAEHIESINGDKDLATYLLSSLESGQSAANPIKYVLVRSRSGETYYPNSSNKYALNCITRLIGNSLVLTTGFDDNWIVDKHPNTGTRLSGDDYDDVGIIEKHDIKPIQFVNVDKIYPPYLNYDTGTNKVGGVATAYYKYCDNNGEFDNITLYFLNQLLISDARFYIDNDRIEELFIDYYNLPAVRDNLDNEYIFGVHLPIHKDNKEKPVISTQFEFSVSDDSIKFTKLFLQRQDMIRSIADTNTLKIYRYGENMNYLDNINVSISNLSIAKINDYCAAITYTGATTVNNVRVKYISICNNSGKSILTYDITKGILRNLYLNIRRY